uniref:Uncharacterized protein n=1 Tax=Meloidogyne enterolobii TaxID=390850 RepID=A0A6V7X7Q9_MELEN|nr:unnamed protein product [Meloidogyne enterolobii]
MIHNFSNNRLGFRKYFFEKRNTKLKKTRSKSHSIFTKKVYQKTSIYLKICISGSVAEINQKNNLLLCLNTRYEQINLNWINECFFTSEVERQSIINCAQNSQIWQTYNSKLKIQQTQPFLGPEPIKNNLWILINNYSLSTIQNYIYILEQMVCLWYNGPGHNRDNCGRCEYEPSRCKIN